MKTTPNVLAVISFIVPQLVLADVTVVLPAQNNTDQTTTTTSETYVQPVQPYVGAVVPVGGAAAIYGAGVNGVRHPNQLNNQLNNQFDHKAGAAGYHEQQNGFGRAEGRGAGERGGHR